MSTPIDFSLIHVRAKTWAERVHISYYSVKIDNMPQNIENKGEDFGDSPFVEPDTGGLNGKPI